VAVLFVSSLIVNACGSDSPTGPSLRTESFPAFTITDPTACNCGNGIAQYTIDVAAAGPLDAVATWTQSDANVIVRLLDASFTNVLATSTATGTTARLSREMVPGSYRVQVFLQGSGGRTATFSLAVTHP
jgi:hypothetical protein